MSGILSTYLDFLRLIASVLVVVHHLRWEEFSGGMMSGMNFGHEAVIIFFVLSGFVISFSHENIDKLTLTFVLKRLARLWSVLIPAIFLTVAFDIAGKQIRPDLYSGNAGILNGIKAIPEFLFFQNENWSTSISLSTNLVLWSLAYEFWFYMLYAVIKSGLNKRYKLFFLVVIAAFVGHKIMLAFPVWFIGSFLYSKRNSFRFSLWVSVPLFILSVVLIPVLKYSPLPSLVAFDHLFFLPMDYSDLIIYDFIIGLVVAVNIISVISIGNHFRYNPGFFHKTVKHLTDVSFTLYCIHVPVLYFLMALFAFDNMNPAHVTTLFILTLITAYLIGRAIEDKRKPLFIFLYSMLPKRS